MLYKQPSESKIILNKITPVNVQTIFSEDSNHLDDHFYFILFFIYF